MRIPTIDLHHWHTCQLCKGAVAIHARHIGLASSASTRVLTLHPQGHPASDRHVRHRDTGHTCTYTCPNTLPKNSHRIDDRRHRLSHQPSRHHHAVQNSGLERPFSAQQGLSSARRAASATLAARSSVQRAQASVPKHTSDTPLCTVLALDGHCTSITGDPSRDEPPC